MLGCRFVQEVAMRTITARIFEDDLDRSRVIGAVRQQSAQEIIHVALNEYVINHRVELEGLFQAVQTAVLSGDSAGLREAFTRETSPVIDDEARRAEELWSAE
jgi:hypothetical protein